MSKLPRASLFLGSTLVLAAAFAACRLTIEAREVRDSERGAAERSLDGGTHAGSMTLGVTGRAFFFEADGAGHAQISLNGSMSSPAGTTTDVIGIRVYGASGNVSAADLAAQDPIGRLPNLASPWEFVCMGPWDGSSTTYSVLVRCIYDQTSGGTKTYGLIADHPGVFNTIVTSPRINALVPPFVPREGDVITSMQAGGTFDQGTGLCLYDVDTTWTGRVSHIRVYAASGTPSPVPQNANNYVGGTTYDPPSLNGSWSGVDLQGTYDGSDTYSVLVVVTYVSGATESVQGTFTGIQGQQGTPIDMD